MLEKTILLVGNPNNIHIYNYCRNVLLNQNYQITIYNPSGNALLAECRYYSFYERHSVEIVSVSTPLDSTLINSLKYLLVQCNQIKSLGSFDILHVHFVPTILSVIFCFFKSKYTKIIVSYWGSDLYRGNKRHFFFQSFLLKIADKITFITQDMVDYFYLHFQEKDYANKIVVLDFGNMFFANIDGYKNNFDITERKEMFGLDSRKYSIALGYSGIKQMQQLEMLNSISKCRTSILNCIEIVLPMHYASQILFEEITSVLNSAQINAYITRDFLDEDRIVKLRTSSEIFINMQMTDALSSSMLEHLYSGSIVINASWLNYSILKESDIFYIEVDSFDKLPMVIDEVISNFQYYREKSECNREKVESICSWSVLKNKWLELYN